MTEAKYMMREDLRKRQMKQLLATRKLAFIFILCTGLSSGVLAVTTAFHVAPEPVGSGARALGQSAFIAVADDATAASWNPAGLINLESPEASFVGAWRTVAIDSSASLSGGHNWSEGQINFMSYAQPIEIGNTDLVLSANYHQVYDLGLKFDVDVERLNTRGESTGAISAHSVACALPMYSYPEITIGASFNLYGESLHYDYVRKVESRSGPSQTLLTETLDDLSGHNFTFGLLWDAYKEREKLLTIGLVYHTPFTAEMDQELVISFLPKPIVIVDRLDMDFPRSVGAGVNLRFCDEFSAAFDVEWKRWSEFTYTDAGSTPSDNTIAYRLGGEYLFLKGARESVLALRGGAVYDPRPAWEEILPVYGLSAGLGWTLKEQLSLDFAYQFRWADEDLKTFDYEIKDEFFVASVIKYF